MSKRHHVVISTLEGNLSKGMRQFMENMPSDLLQVDWLLSYFSLQHKLTRSTYVNFIGEGIGLASI
jgi:hypothetical protein